MQAEYVAKITGDTTGLEKAIQKANGSIKRLEQDEVLIKLNYDGNVQGFNAEFDKILKSCPDLTIQFQYNVNQKMLDKELNKLKDLQDLKLDINTNNADKKIQSMILSLDEAIGKDQSQSIIESKIKEIYKYANTINKLGGKININFTDEIYKSVEGTDFEKVFDKLIGSANIDKIKLFDINGSIDKEITDTEKRIEDFQNFLSNLELKGASKNGLLSEIDEVREEIKILRSDLDDMNKQLGTVSGEQFRNLADDIKDVNIQLQNALDKIARLSGEYKLGSIVNQWQKQEVTKTNERYTAFNSSTLETSGVHLAADAEGVSEKLIREAIQEMGGEADGFIHSHPNNIAAFSDTDIATFYKLLNEGITQQVVTSFQQAMTLDMSKVDSSKSEEVVTLLREKYDEAEQEIGTQFLRNNLQTVQQISNDIFDNNLVGNSVIDGIITQAKQYYNETIEKLGNQITLGDYSSAVDNAISKAFNESTIANQKNTPTFSKVKTFMGDIADAIVESLGDIEANKDALQTRFQSILMDVFSTSDYLKEGVRSAIKIENISDFIDTNMLKQAGQQLGTAVTNGFREGIDAHSNSKEAERAVDDFANGVVDEFSNRTPDMQEAATNAGKAVAGSFNESLQEGITETKIYSPTQQFDNVIQQDLVYLENYKNTVAEINKLKIAPQTDETKQKIEELQKLANYFFGNISITRNQLGNDGGNFANDPYGTYKNRLSIQGYGEKAYEIFKIGNQIKSDLDINNLTSSFSSIGDEIARIENQSESLRQSLNKNLVESTQYVNQLKRGIETLADSYEVLHDPAYAKDTDYLNGAKKDIESILTKFPELEQFKDRFTSENQAWEFIKTDEWNNFLATLPQAQEYLKSIGYDFEKIGETKTASVIDNIYGKILEYENGEKHLESDIGLTYDQLISKIQQENAEIEKGNGLFQERVTFLKNGKVIESYIGNEDSVKGVHTPYGADQLIHTHPNSNSMGKMFSPTDMVSFLNDKTIKGLNNFELITGSNSSVKLDLSYFRNDTIDYITDYYMSLYEAIGIAFGEEITKGHIKIPDNANKELMTKYQNILTQKLFESLGYGDQINLGNIDMSEINAKLADQIYKMALNITDRIRELPYGENFKEATELHHKNIHENFEDFRSWKNTQQEKQYLVPSNSDIDKINEFKEAYEKLHGLYASLSLDDSIIYQDKIHSEILALEKTYPELNTAATGFKTLDEALEIYCNRLGIAKDETFELSQSQEQLNEERAKMSGSSSATEQIIETEEREAQAAQMAAEQEKALAKAREEATQSSSSQLPAVIPMVDNQAKATEAFYKDIAKYQQDIFSGSGASQSGEMIKYEAKELATLQENAEGAAKSKNKFAVANGAVLASIVKSLSGISSEGDALKSIISVIQSFNANSNGGGVASSVDKQKSKVEQAIDLYNKLYDAQIKQSRITPGANVDRYNDFTQKIEEARQAIEALGLSEEEQAQVAERTKDAQVNAINAINEAERKRQVEADKTNAKLQQSVQQAEKLQATVRKQATSMMSNGKLMNAYGDQIRDILTQIDSINTSVNPNEAINQLKRLQSELVKVSSTAEQAGKSGKTLGQMFSTRFKSLISYLGTFVSFYRIVSYVRTAISTIKDLDTQLVDLRKTTTMTASELEQFYHASSDVAKQMGVTTSEIISQASAWSRLGYSSNEAATEMAKLSSQFTSISPGMTTDNATDYLVSTMKAYDVEVDEVERKIMDNVNRIGNTFATTNAEIGEMLTRSSAAMKAANNSLEETIALESAAVQITRNAETTGTAFRTVSMRIRGYNEDSEDGLEELDESLQNISGDIADLTKVNGKGGVSIFTDKDRTEYKSTYQILKEISEIWDDLTDKQQADLLEKLGGKRGGQTLAGILDNFSEVDRALQEMENAAGSADAEMTIIQDKQNCLYVQQCA